MKYSIKGQTKLHFITLTKVPQLDRYFLYAHTHHLETDVTLAQQEEYAVPERDEILHSPILSYLANHKDFSFLKSNSSLCENSVNDNLSNSCDMNTDQRFEGDFDKTNDSKSHEKIASVTIMSYNTWNYFTFSGHSSHYPFRIRKLCEVFITPSPPHTPPAPPPPHLPAPIHDKYYMYQNLSQRHDTLTFL